MIRRHPHVFGEAQVETAEEVRQQWRRIKKQEKPADGDTVCCGKKMELQQPNKEKSSD